MVSLFRIPNAGNSTTLSASYNNGTTTYYSKPTGVRAAASAATLLTPTLITGTAGYLQIRSAVNNQGNNYTSSPILLPSGATAASLTFAYTATPTMYLNTYDTEGNFINSTNAGVWSWSAPSVATLSTGAASSNITINPLSAGTGL